MTAHNHRCDVPNCRETMACNAPLESHDTSTGVGAHCSLEEVNTVFLCDEHADWETCPWCGQWYDYEHVYATHPPACSQACADELQPPSEADYAEMTADERNDSAKEDAA